MVIAKLLAEEFESNTTKRKAEPFLYVCDGPSKSIFISLYPRRHYYVLQYSNETPVIPVIEKLKYIELINFITSLNNKAIHK